MKFSELQSHRVNTFFKSNQALCVRTDKNKWQFFRLQQNIIFKFAKYVSNFRLQFVLQLKLFNYPV